MLVYFVICFMLYVSCFMLRNSFTKKRVGTLTLGEKLRQLRNGKRMALNEVSRITKIQIAYLEYLEEGRWDRLPADVYVRGFLRSYADFLGVGGNVLIKLYEKEKGIKKNLEESKNPQAEKSVQKPINISSFVFTPQKIAMSLIAILIFSGLFYLYKEIGSFTDAPRLIILNPQPDTSVDGNSLRVEGVTDKDVRVFVNDQPILVGDDGKFSENITLQSGINALNMKAINKFGKETLSSLSIRSNFKEDTAQSGQDGSKEESVLAELSEIQIEIKVDPGPVWLSVEADENLVFSGTMLSGAVQSFRAGDKIVINSGRANATYVKFNGKDIGTLGQDPGAVRGVVFNRDTKY